MLIRTFVVLLIIFNCKWDRCLGAAGDFSIQTNDQIFLQSGLRAWRVAICTPVGV
jgi:hypothetical protein